MLCKIKVKNHCKNRVRSILLNVGSKKIVISQNGSNLKRYSRYSQEDFCRDWSNNEETLWLKNFKIF